MRARSRRSHSQTGVWSFVISGISGLAWSVLDDRERYRMLKYIYVSPSDFLVVLLGRGLARVAVGGMGAAITLALSGQQRPDPVQILVALLATGAVATLAATVVFRTSDGLTKDRGLLDQTTGS